MTKPTTQDRERKQLRAESDKRPPIRNGYGYCFFDFVVFRINQFKPGAELRTVVLKTGGMSSRVQDSVRCQRLSRRLQKWAGVKFTTVLHNGRTCDGLFGTVFGYTA